MEAEAKSAAGVLLVLVQRNKPAAVRKNPMLRHIRGNGACVIRCSAEER